MKVGVESILRFTAARNIIYVNERQSENYLRWNDQLCDAVGIAQDDETVHALVLNPALEFHILADVPLAQLAACVRPIGERVDIRVRP